MSEVLGIGIDLTQHEPLVSVAVWPPAARSPMPVTKQSLAQHWPPAVELRGNFRRQVPVAVLPMLAGEPLLLADAAASHRRGAGFPWPPEAEAPYAGDMALGVGRIPLVAAWAALLPRAGGGEAMTQRDDYEFKWRPECREHVARAGTILAASIKAFLTTAAVPFHSCLTAIVVPDSLDEAGQQILLDNLAQVGIASESVHLLPRPLAVALRWCQTSNLQTRGVSPNDDEEGHKVARVRVLTTPLDIWEVVSLEVRSRYDEGRAWLTPVRDRTKLVATLPEIRAPGVSIGLALARAEKHGDKLGWWRRLFGSDWLLQRLNAQREMSPAELESVRAIRSPSPPESFRQEVSLLNSLQPLWSRFFQPGPALQEVLAQQWPHQERELGISSLPCSAVLTDGAFAGLRMERGATLAQVAGGNGGQASSPHTAAVFGAAVAAVAIANNLPCYRETLLPLDLYVLGKDEYDDPSPQWRELIASRSVEAGRVWRSPAPVTGMQIREAQDRLLLPLRRVMQGKPTFRQVGTELAAPAKHDEPIRVEVEVKPGQGYARVRLQSVTPSVFSTRLDWRTMQECKEPAPPKLAYLPGVSRIIPDPEMFRRAEETMRSALDAMERSSPATAVRLRTLITFLNKWPLAHHVERTRGHRIDKDFMLHYGVIGSAGKLEALPAPGLARALRAAIGAAFERQVARGHPRSAAATALLRTAGWLYLAMPDECYEYLRQRLHEAGEDTLSLAAVELHAIGLGFDQADDIRVFYPLLVHALHSGQRPNNWLRALRNICRFRNHALRPDTMPETLLQRLVRTVLGIMQQQADEGNLRRIFSNCLETLPFLLKRRRYDPDFLAPNSHLAVTLLQLLNRIDSHYLTRLPTRLQAVPKATVNFLRMEATVTDLEQLLGIEDDEEADD